MGCSSNRAKSSLRSKQRASTSTGQSKRSKANGRSERGGTADMIDSTDELIKSYEVTRSIVMRHGQYDAAMILTLNLATCIAADSRQDEPAALARIGDSIRTLCDAVTDMMDEE